jgi:stress-induced morphogen
MAAGLYGGRGLTAGDALTVAGKRPIVVATLREFRHCRLGSAGPYSTGERAMAMAANDIERLIRARIPDAEVTIRDLAGDGDHYAATVIAESFRGKSRVQQHQIVYEALRAEMGGKLHALALQTGTPGR